MHDISIVSPDKGVDRGGIQAWMYYLELLFQENGLQVLSYSMRQDSVSTFFKCLRSKLIIAATWKMLILLLPCLVLRRKILVFVHGNEILGLGVISRLFLRFIRRTGKVLFIANSYAISDILESNIGFSADYVQYPFIGKATDSVSSKVSNKNSDIIKFVTIARLVKRKNINSVLLALAKIRSAGYDFLYHIVGAGPEKDSLVNLALELDLRDCVVFHGRVSEGDKNKLLSDSDFFLLPSIYDVAGRSIEGFGMVFIEANMFGVPVLSGNTGGMKEAVVDGVTGVVCDGSVLDVENGLLKLILGSYDREKIKRHSEKFFYGVQHDFFAFISAHFDEFKVD